MHLKPRTAAIMAALAVVVALIPHHPAMAGPDGKAIAGKSDCFACHNVMNSEGKKMGPSYEDVAKKYAKDPKAAAMLAGVIKKGGSGHWGGGAMPPHPALSDADTKALATWVLATKGKEKPKPAKPVKSATP
ncbi:MAG: cytochrome c class [Cyanobacteria bacterium RYN_339]|nr:cytochrome c class [Cyanobacteria bacterium RYN_339]